MKTQILKGKIANLLRIDEEWENRLDDTEPGHYGVEVCDPYIDEDNIRSR